MRTTRRGSISATQEVRSPEESDEKLRSHGGQEALARRAFDIQASRLRLEKWQKAEVTFRSCRAGLDLKKLGKGSPRYPIRGK